MFSNYISKALEETTKAENRNKQGLQVDPVFRPNVRAWFERSVKVFGLLINGQRGRSRIQIRLRGTCTADTILQALTWLYIDDVHFRKTINARVRTSPDADLARFISLFAQTGISRNIYRMRWEFLSKICSVSSSANSKLYQCFNTYSDIIDGLVAPQFPTMTVTTNCKCQIKNIFSFLPIDFDQYRSGGLKGLQHAIDERNKGFSGERILCKRCGEKHTENNVFGDIVFIMLGPLVADLPKVEAPQDLLRTIHLKDQNYVLTCFSDFDLSELHVRINCRRMNGKWYQYDDNVMTAEPTTFGKWVDVLIYKKSVLVP